MQGLALTSFLPMKIGRVLEKWVYYTIGLGPLPASCPWAPEGLATPLTTVRTANSSSHVESEQWLIDCISAGTLRGRPARPLKQGPRGREATGALAPALFMPLVFWAALKGFYFLEHIRPLRWLAPHFKVGSAVPVK